MLVVAQITRELIVLLRILVCTSYHAGVPPTVVSAAEAIAARRALIDLHINNGVIRQRCLLSVYEHKPCQHARR